MFLNQSIHSVFGSKLLKCSCNNSKDVFILKRHEGIHKRQILVTPEEKAGTRSKRVFVSVGCMYAYNSRQQILQPHIITNSQNAAVRRAVSREKHKETYTPFKEWDLSHKRTITLKDYFLYHLRIF